MQSTPASSNFRALLFGATGQIGAAVLVRLLALGWEVTAVSRRPPAGSSAGVTWVAGDLGNLPEMSEAFDLLISCGPLDHFAAWYARSGCMTGRVIAFGSTSVLVKGNSIDPAEQDLALRLKTAEQLLFDLAAARGAGLTVLRPTLVWGAGLDRSLSRIASLASRFGHFALPSNATGRRQPVHVEDLAMAVMQLLDCPSSHAKAYAVGGGEVLGYRQMVGKVLDALPGRPVLWSLPGPVFGIVAAAGRRAGLLSGFTPAVLARMQQDLVFDLTPAQQDFGYAPRGFNPTAAELGLAQ